MKMEANQNQLKYSKSFLNTIFEWKNYMNIDIFKNSAVGRWMFNTTQIQNVSPNLKKPWKVSSNHFYTFLYGAEIYSGSKMYN